MAVRDNRCLRLNRAAGERQLPKDVRVIKSWENGDGLLSSTLEIAVRIACYTLVFVPLALWEWHAPRRRLDAGRRRRWPGNLGILAIDIVTVRLLVPAAAVGFSVVAYEGGWGLFPLLGMPFWLNVVTGVIVLDLVIYTQ